MTMIPKSLHTVTALVALAKYVKATGSDADTNIGAVYAATNILGYSVKNDVYNLVDKAIRAMDKASV
jgi:hypothetical protein